jgi:hypothetical protein
MFEPDGYDEVVFRRGTARRELVTFWFSGGRVLIGMGWPYDFRGSAAGSPSA